MRHPFCQSAVALASVLLISAQTADQALDSISVRVRSEMVVIDFIPTDVRGEFVTDLRPEDLVLKEDGKEQEIVYFQRFDHSRPVIRIDGEPLLPNSSAEFGAPPEITRLVFLLDLQTMPAGDMVYARQQISDFIRRHRRPQQQYLLATAGFDLRVRVPFTDDLDSLVTALESLPLESDTRVDEIRFTAFMEEIEAFFQIAPTIGLFAMQPAESAVQSGRAFLQELEHRLTRMSGSAIALVRMLRPLPGRKHVVLLSGGYPLEAAQSLRDIIRERMELARPGMPSAERAQLSVLLGQLQKLNLENHLRRLIDEANRSQVSLYCVDSRGLMPAQGNPEAHRGRSGLQHRTLYHRFASLDILEPQDFLASLARESGGRHFFNNNDLTIGVARALADASQYYVLAYRPKSARRAGRFHRVKLEPRRAGVEIQYRRGYFQLDDSQLNRSEVLNAFQHPFLYRDFDFRVEVDQAGSETRVTTHIPTSALSFAPGQDDGMFRCPLDTYGVLVDLKTGRWLEGKLQFAKSHSLEVNRIRLAEVRQVDFVTTTSSFEAPPGEYVLITVVRQSTAGRMSAITRPLTIPAGEPGTPH